MWFFIFMNKSCNLSYSFHKYWLNTKLYILIKIYMTKLVALSLSNHIHGNVFLQVQAS